MEDDDSGIESQRPEAAAELLSAYQGLRVETYRDHIDYPGSWTKLAVVAHADDADTMLNHSLIQAQTRFDLGPS